MDDRIVFLENFTPLHSKGITTPMKDRKFPIGVACAIVGKYSIEEHPLCTEETEIDRHQDVYDFFEAEQESPWYGKNNYELTFHFPTIYCNYETILFLMNEYVQNLKFQ